MQLQFVSPPFSFALFSTLASNSQSIAIQPFYIPRFSHVQFTDSDMMLLGVVGGSGGSDPVRVANTRPAVSVAALTARAGAQDAKSGGKSSAAEPLLGPDQTWGDSEVPACASCAASKFITCGVYLSGLGDSRVSGFAILFYCCSLQWSG